MGAVGGDGSAGLGLAERGARAPSGGVDWITGVEWSRGEEKSGGVVWMFLEGPAGWWPGGARLAGGSTDGCVTVTGYNQRRSDFRE